MTAIPLLFAVLVIRADDHADLHGSGGREVDKLEAGVVGARRARARIHRDAQTLSRVVDGEVIDLVVVLVIFVGLHHEAAAGQLAQYAGFAAFGIQNQHLGFMRDLHPFESASFDGMVALRRVLDHCTCSPNALTGSMSTGTSLMLLNDDFNPAGINPYF